MQILEGEKGITPPRPSPQGRGEGGRKCRGGLLPDAGAAAFVLVGGGGDGEKKGQADAEKEQVGTRFGGFVRCVDVVQGDRKVLRPIGGSSGMPGRSRSGGKHIDHSVLGEKTKAEERSGGKGGMGV